LLEDLGKTAGHIHELLRNRLVTARRRLDDLSCRRALRRPLDRVQLLNQRLDDVGDRVQRGIRERMHRCRLGIDAAAARLEALSPLNVLSRGYSLTRRANDNAVIRKASQVEVGDMLVTTLHVGQVTSRTEKIDLPKRN
jgi:exodeoxyribonuclease VII large subunit